VSAAAVAIPRRLLRLIVLSRNKGIISHQSYKLCI
jgi:hypothetical protein